MECDAPCRAAPGIYAAGDVASWHNPHFGTRMRLEHRINATQQAMVAVCNLLGDAKPFAPVPYFWTDQYDTRIQAYGVLGWNAPPARYARCVAWSSNARRGRPSRSYPRSARQP
ncbi:hypothetical protein [Streptomyces mirabilis]|uniref:hypothetical protein n=1 Tax=Streptomyces mirabilis TaxID=68239 RepID=UPI0033A6EE2F